MSDRRTYCLGNCGASWPYLSASKYKGGRPREWCEACYRIHRRMLRKDMTPKARNAAALELHRRAI